MTLDVPARKIKGYWKRKPVRFGVVFLVALAAIGAQYRLAHLRLSVEVGDTSKVPLRPIRLGEELVIIDPVLQAPESPVFAYKGEAGEAVDLQLEQARIAAETIRNYDFGAEFKSNAGRIFYITDPRLDSASNTEPCLTVVEAEADKTKSLPHEIRFSQPGTPGNESLRELDVLADTQVLLRNSTFPADSVVDNGAEITDNGPGCAKRLSLAAGSESLQGLSVVKLGAAANSKIKFLFWPLTKSKPMWAGSDGFFEPFKVASPVFQARALSVRSKTGSLSLEIKAENPAEPLRINRLKVGSDQLLVDVSGKGFVTVDGETISLSLFERIQKYPLPAGLLMMGNAALLAWLGRQVRGLFKPQPD